MSKPPQTPSRTPPPSNYGSTEQSQATDRTPLLTPPRPSHPSSSNPTSPSPSERALTAAEQAEYERGLLTWDRATNWRFWVRWEYIPIYLLASVFIVGVLMVAVFHREIIEALMPLVRGLRDLKGGWVIPIAVISVLSFPPLFGNEVVLILVGVVWGLEKGFAIVAVGTVIGEMGSFTAYSTCCRRRAYRLAHSSLNYACMVRVIAQGGLFMAWVVRLSAVPTHVSTVIFAVCGLQYSKFLAALVLSLPKQFVAVYLGVMVNGESKQQSQHLSRIVVASSVVITLGSLWYVNWKMLRVRKEVFLEMREDLARRGVQEPLPPGEE